MLCAASGDCVIADFLRFETSSLPSALAGRDYATTLEASGGIAPYQWLLEGETPVWLSLDGSTGTLTAGAFDLVAGSYELSVVLRDKSNGGDGHATEKTFSWRVDNCQSGLPCWTAEGLTCMVGSQDCVDGILQRCVAADPPVFPENLNRCGPDCRGCEENRANLCVDGRCRCGANEPCAVGHVCCGETTDALCLDSTLAHCGACDNHCGMRVLNADGVSCTNEQCDYEQCLDGWYDCDNDRSNGCEQEQSVAHCAGCDNNCLALPNVQNATCDDLSSQCLFECMPDWGACHPDNLGCETPLDTLEHCGGCGIVCAGPLCETGADGFFCGCNLAENFGDDFVGKPGPDGNMDCHIDEICCTADTGRGACVPHNPEHCFDCDEVCMPSTGGPSCILGEFQKPWACECNDDESCKNYVFSEAVCSPDTDQCACGDLSSGCEPPEACCLATNHRADCTDLSIDSQCVNGACQCLDGFCAGPPGIACINEICVCEAYGAQPCPLGMYCRTNGCCLDMFDSECCGNENVWCSDGSCRQPQDCP